MKKILLVDDEVGLTTLLKMNLQSTGKFEVRTENRGAIAAQAAREFQPDFIVLDVLMPDLEGPDALNKIREIPSMRHVPVVFLTATVMKGETSVTDTHSGGYSFMAKPVTAAELTDVIDMKVGV